eukprot:SAG31_NODE_16480_length_707_cov_1.694079_1_plen_201_part_10
MRRAKSTTTWAHGRGREQINSAHGIAVDPRLGRHRGVFLPSRRVDSAANLFVADWAAAFMASHVEILARLKPRNREILRHRNRKPQHGQDERRATRGVATSTCLLLHAAEATVLPERSSHDGRHADRRCHWHASTPVSPFHPVNLGIWSKCPAMQHLVQNRLAVRRRRPEPNAARSPKPSRGALLLARYLCRVPRENVQIY